MSPFRNRYAPIPVDEEDEKHLSIAPQPRYSAQLITYFVAVHLAFIAVLALYLRPHESVFPKSTLWALELPSAASAIQYETVTFANSGFSEAGAATPYEGPPTVSSNALWKNLTSVGMYALQADEYLPLHDSPEFNLTTAPVVDFVTREPTGEYIVTLEVFHQLHCLNYLRQRLYETPGEKFYEPESDKSRSMHLSHCIDYLRQVLMCHGDMTPITLDTAPHRNPPYMPNFEIKHTCRNWDSVWEFARQGNTTGIPVE